jgi:hypothetical protein
MAAENISDCQFPIGDWRLAIGTKDIASEKSAIGIRQSPIGRTLVKD